eukprot:TRINITY_DN10572_c0_g1_i1.p1 TRINITY_DN10572_c0_g1~~TRINITY_DN10572_c0_g1_i1.p1  ORF type:complete len:364 (+),score=65.55 TRINITY_DN10572_c0_g1_i1:74-1093(+)
MNLVKTTGNGGRCLDGSQPAYYFYPGTGDGVDKWYVYHQGGGWCTSVHDCYKRSLTRLGSTVNATKTMTLPGGYFSADEKVNPTMHNWNKVFFLYCDGGSYSGSRLEPVEYNSEKLYFRGFYNLHAYMNSLETKNILNATEVVISGCSAGGLATYLHVDWWASHFSSSVKVRGLPDSGFFLDYNSPLANVPQYGTNLRWVFKEMNCTFGVNQDCIKANVAAPEKCMFAEHTGPHIKIPIFPLQSMFDSWQSAHILGSNETAPMNKYGQLLEKRIKASVLSNSKNGLFLDSCFHHCGEWDAINIGGQDSARAFDSWYKTGKNGAHLQNKVYPCEGCCHGK